MPGGQLFNYLLKADMKSFELSQANDTQVAKSCIYIDGYSLR